MRVACSYSFDCAGIAVPGGYDCFRSCEKHYCQIEAATQTVGAGPCFGEKEGDEGTEHEEPGSETVYLMCDSLANLYCDLTSHRCAAVKASGAACTGTGDECGLGSYCDPKAHVCTSKQVGDACAGDECGLDRTCDEATRVCVARKPDGAACKLYSDCLSHRCDHDSGVCVRPPPKACTATR
jgi:hypothetical protein